MIILDSLLTGGIKFVLDKIATAVDREMTPENNESAMREELLALQMRLELGEIDDEQYAAEEGELLARLREAQRRRSLESAQAAGAETTPEGEAGEEEAGGEAAEQGGALSFDPRRHTIGVEVTFASEEEPE